MIWTFKSSTTDLIDQSGPLPALPFLDPVSCIVTELRNNTLLEKSFTSTRTARDWSLANCLSFCQFLKSVDHGGWQNEANDGHETRYLIFCLQGLRPLPSLHLFITALGLVSILPQRTLGFSKWRQRLSLEVATF